jgi:predicted signal transduction protein with EAL and GGDEF domain
MSVGGSLIEAGNNTIEDVLERSDKQLYIAKGSGRNCVVFEGVGKLDPEEFKLESRQMIE